MAESLQQGAGAGACTGWTAPGGRTGRGPSMAFGASKNQRGNGERRSERSGLTTSIIAKTRRAVKSGVFRALQLLAIFEAAVVANVERGLEDDGQHPHTLVVLFAEGAEDARNEGQGHRRVGVVLVFMHLLPPISGDRGHGVVRWLRHGAGRGWRTGVR